MNKAYLLIGGNVGNRLQNLHQAITLLETCGHVSRQSGVYETAAWGHTEQSPFLNQALLLTTDQSAHGLMAAILQIEEQMGRKRTVKYGPRIIDIDILFYNDEVIHQPHLCIPHPEIQNRRFVLEPMLELAPALVHPVLQKSIAQLLEECPDKLEVRKIDRARPDDQAGRGFTD